MARLTSASSPSVPATHAISAKTPKGVSSITIMVTFCMITAPLSKTFWTGSPSSLAIKMPMPISRLKTISGSTATSAITCTGLSGTIDKTMSTAVVSLGSGVSPFWITLVSSPAPGWTSVPRPSPIHTAIWPVTTNSSIALPPTAPSLRKSPIAATPETRLKKISGTTSILIALMKKSPIHLMLSASGPQAQPVRTPRMSAVITRCHSGISNQVFSKSQPLVVRSSSSNHCTQRVSRGNSCRNCRGLHSFVTRCPLSRRARRARCACRSGSA